MKRKLRRRGFKRPTYQGQPCTPYASLGPTEPIEMRVECDPSPVRGQPKDPPWRSKAYLAWVRALPCVMHLDCPGTIEASHHQREGHGSTGMKASDERAIPLCSEAHRRFHRTGRIGRRSAEGTRVFIEEVIALQLKSYPRPIPDYVKARYPDIWRGEGG